MTTPVNRKPVRLHLDPAILTEANKMAFGSQRSPEDVLQNALAGWLADRQAANRKSQLESRQKDAAP